MNCLEFKKHISLYLELKENNEDTIAFDTHLTKCQFCQQEVNKYLELDKKLKEINDISPVRNYKEHFWKALEYKEAFDRIKIKKRAYYGLAAALVIVVSFIFLMKFYLIEYKPSAQDIKDEELLIQVNEILSSPVISSNSALAITEEELNLLDSKDKEGYIKINKNIEIKEVNYV